MTVLDKNNWIKVILAVRKYHLSQSFVFDLWLLDIPVVG